MGTACMKKIYLRQLLDKRFTVILWVFTFCMLSSRVGFTNKTHRRVFSARNWPIRRDAMAAGSPCNLQDASVSICGTSYMMTVDPGYSNYTWDDGSTGTTRTVTSSGTYYWETVNYSYNAVTNGDFETSPNHYTGFTSSYTKDTQNLYTEGDYAVITNPHNEHANFASFGDHTTGSGYMMVVNGASVANINVWSEPISVVKNTTYVFSVWGTSVTTQNPGHLTFSINGTQLGNIQLSSTTGQWQNFTVRWSSGSNTTANISIVNLNTASNGNDFALDDISFSPVCRKNITVTLNPNPAKPVISQN